MSQCPSCGTTMTCHAQSGACWCMQYPNILETPDAENLSCLCEACLSKQINTRLTALYQTYSTNQLIRLARPYAANNALKEGLDYTVENGLYVFSAWYHLKRGSCCGNGCRHCPYGKSADDTFYNAG